MIKVLAKNNMTTNKRIYKEHDIIPKAYDIFINLLEENFDGVVEIELEPTQDMKVITINSSELVLKSAQISHEGDLYSAKISYKKDSAKLYFQNSLISGTNYKLKIVYSGKYSKTMSGLYRSSYKEDNFYSTHFEPTDARKAFPCFDHPELKAVFKLSIKADDKYTKLSNTKVEKIVDGVVHFEKTEMMSTYLVAFVVGNLDYIQIETNRDVPIRVYAHPEEIKYGKHALNVAKYSLEFFEKYFDLNYTFKKLDLVSVPEFAMGAMENWGLVTFRKTSLLYDEKNDTIPSKMSVADTVAHELAHMWFGNLVTMKWWDDLWLNEGFATWAASMAMYNLPSDLVEYDIWLHFVNNNLEVGMKYDALHVSHPISVKVDDPEEINQIFDNISYNKGSSIIRMFENYIGHENFRKNISGYLKYFKHNNATSNDIFMFQKLYPQIQKDFSTWIKKEGFPLIVVNDLGNELELMQTRFLLGNKNKDDKIWSIPIQINFKGKNVKKILLEKKTLKIKKESNIYKLNIHNAGVYRVLYDIKVFKNLYFEDIFSKDRLNLVNDMFSLAIGGYLNIKDVFEIISSRTDVDDYEVLKSILSNLYSIASLFYDEIGIKKMIFSMITNIIQDKIPGINVETLNIPRKKILMDSLILHYGVLIGNEEILDKLKSSYKIYKKDKYKILPDFRQSMMYSVVDKIFEDFSTEIDKPGIKSNTMVIRALGRTKNKEKLASILPKYKNIDRQNVIFFFDSLGENIENREMVIDYFIENYKNIVDYVNNPSLVNNILRSVLGRASKSETSSKIKKFLTAIKNNESEREVSKIQELNEIYTSFRINSQSSLRKMIH